MHLTTFFSLATMALAVPLLHDRDMKVILVTDWEIETVTSYVTVWNPSTTSTAAVVQPTTTPIAQPSPDPTTTPATTAASTVPTQQPQNPPPAPAPSSDSSATTAQSYPVTVLPGATAADGPCTPGHECSGDITHFNPSMGVGACGYKDWATQSIWQDTDLVVAVSSQIMGSFSNGGTPDDVNTLCKRSVHIKAQAGGQDVVARVVDKCPTCPGDFDLDLSPKVFDLVAPQGNGRVHNVEWYWV